MAAKSDKEKAMKFEIKSRITGKVIFECDAESMRIAVELAVFKKVDLRYSNLRGSDLSGSNLSGSNLSYSNLREIKKDFFERLTQLENEAVGLYRALLDGQIDGSCYTGTYCCFMGTAARVRGVDLTKLQKLTGLSRDSNSPTEKWFLAIRPGDGEANPVVEVTAEWIREWAKEKNVVLPNRKTVWE